MKVINIFIEDHNYDIKDGFSLFEAFPNFVKIPWVQIPPHQLLQQTHAITYNKVQIKAVFHRKVIDIYKGHFIGVHTLFPGEGLVFLELLDMSFIRTFELEGGYIIISEHIFANGMVSTI